MPLQTRAAKRVLTARKRRNDRAVKENVLLSEYLFPVSSMICLVGMGIGIVIDIVIGTISGPD